MVVAPSSIPDPRVRQKVAYAGGHWLWTGAREGRHGYFIRRVRGVQRKTYVHRYAYETFRGSIPAGHGVRRTCRTKDAACLNPDHLETYPLR